MVAFADVELLLLLLVYDRYGFDDCDEDCAAALVVVAFAFIAGAVDVDGDGYWKTFA